MKTKIVYVLVSSPTDIYLEQAYVSIFSLRYFNKKANVSVICDNRTAQRINDTHTVIRSLIDNIISVPFFENVSNRERSRWLKTNMRELVEGDFLFLDTDTIVTDSLSEIDTIDVNIGMVYDWHCRLADRPNKSGIEKRVNGLFSVKLKPETDYFNSGVIFSKDNEKGHSFFSLWHKNWESAKDKPMGIQDQQSLTVTVNELGGVSPLPGYFNCQPIVSMRYLSTAKIVHFFNTKWTTDTICPFFSKDFYLAVKKNKEITAEQREMILNCRTTFISPTMAICNDDINIWRSPAFKLLRKLYRQHRFTYKLINKTSKIFVKINRNGF